MTADSTHRTLAKQIMITTIRRGSYNTRELKIYLLDLPSQTSPTTKIDIFWRIPSINSAYLLMTAIAKERETYNS